jgi:hypothetical protein
MSGLLGAGMVALLAVLVGCRQKGPEAVRPTPAPAPGFGAVLDSALPTDQALRDYVGRLQFDTDYEAGDMQRLAIGRYPDLHYGPLAAIQPEIGNHTLSEDDLHHGRIIARIVNYSDELYPKIGLAPHGVTYWWAQLGADRTKDRYAMIDTDSAGHIVNVVRGALRYDGYNHAPVYRIRASARWLWQEDDEQGWSSCGNSCCKN